MSDLDVEQAAEEAARAYLQAQAIAWVQPPATDPGGADRVYCGLEGREVESESGQLRTLKLPCIVASCQSAEPVLPSFHGNWNAILRIEIMSADGDTTGEVHAERVRQIGRLFYTNRIHTDLSNAIPEFWVGKVVPSSRGWDRTEGRWVSYLEFTLVSCFPKRITEA